MSIKHALFCAGALALAAAHPALAQKSKDTLRVGFFDPISTVDQFFDPKPETSFLTRGIFNSLVDIDVESGKVIPCLAESWNRIDDKTLEFKLRKDVKFHDGSAFDADDVVYTVTWLIDPQTKLRFKENFEFIDHAEKVDQYTVRIIAKQPIALDLVRIATSLLVLPSDVHGAYQNKVDFGKKPVGTGPYRVASVDTNAGILLIKGADLFNPGRGSTKATIGRVQALPVPEVQTQIAHFIRGELDILHDIPKDQMEAMIANPDNKVTPSQGLAYFYMNFDSAGRSGFKPFTDIRVRKAVSMALDRDSLAKNILEVGNNGAVKPMDVVCLKIQQACAWSTKPPAYNVAEAKKLMAEAGYADGFDLKITTMPGANELGEAIAGELRKIGIRAVLDKSTMAVYRKKQTDGELQELVALYTSGGLPDASALLNFYFDGAGRDYARDPQMTAWANEGEKIMDPKKRDDMYRAAFDRMNEMSYVLPITNKPTFWLHTKDIEVIPGSLAPIGGEPNFIHWK